MAKYFGTFSCGCEGHVNIIGPGKYREWKIENAFSKLCPECFKKEKEAERIKANEEALIKAKEMELPDLEGTEKQIAWAIKLRHVRIEAISKMFQSLQEDAFDKDLKKCLKIIFKTDDSDRLLEYLSIFEEELLKNTKSTFFIENRLTNTFELLEEQADTIINYENIKEDEYIKNQIIKENTLEPTVVKYEEVVNIEIVGETIEAYYEYNKDFIKNVKKLSFKWDNDKKCWFRKTNELTGSYIDRAAELANELLNLGFRVSIPEKEMKEKAINGTYERECNRWIITDKEKNKLKIKWYGDSENLYSISKKAYLGRWVNSSVITDISKYEKIEEFAQMYDCNISQEAKKLIEQYKKELENIEKVDVVKTEKLKNKDGLKDILNSSREILDDLVDED